MNSIDLIAYIDPMSGAIVLQLIIAAFVGVGTFFRHTIFGGISRLMRPSKNESNG